MRRPIVPSLPWLAAVAITLVASVPSLPATIAALKRRPLRGTVIIDWPVVMRIFLIPESHLRFELDCSQGPLE